ncbi:MAG: hypothetical protein NUW01_19095, partial [Gemmatimonadaceae bacterium]|nr:hypothetical protein [Gemmatimonadaceae bacterium]
KELEPITSAVMERIRSDKIQIRPKIYFIIGSLLTFVGLVSSVVCSVFFVGLIRFSLRAHGPMGAYRLDQLLSSFPWWALVSAVAGLILGTWLIRRYDFAWKFRLGAVIAGFILAVVAGGLIVDATGLNDLLARKGPFQGMMRPYMQNGPPLDFPRPGTR